ncbi:hypothetical protein KCV07_g9552, partial [Aureobasidium melanogenum]
MFNMLLRLGAPCTGIILSPVFAASALGSRFIAETGGLQVEDLLSSLPTQFNVSQSQTPYGGDYGDSYWSSSFITGTDDREYFILSHTLITTSLEVYRGSILDIAGESFHQYTYAGNSSSHVKNLTTFNLDFGDFGFGAVGENALGTVNTFLTSPDVTYNITFDLSTPMILNGGSGTFNWERNVIANEWSVPAGLTHGSFNIHNQTIVIDPVRSMTWYDRQWEIGSADSWTWFELHVGSAEGSFGTKYSIWFYKSGYINGITKGFATVRERPGIQKVIPVTLSTSNRTWTSPSTGVSYPLDYTIRFVNGLVLDVSSIIDDQELWFKAEDVELATYEGFVNVTGSQAGKLVSGFGLVEIEPNRKPAESHEGQT